AFFQQRASKGEGFSGKKKVSAVACPTRGDRTGAKDGFIRDQRCCQRGRCPTEDHGWHHLLGDFLALRSTQRGSHTGSPHACITANGLALWARSGTKGRGGVSQIRHHDGTHTPARWSAQIMRFFCRIFGNACERASD